VALFLSLEMHALCMEKCLHVTPEMHALCMEKCLHVTPELHAIYLPHEFQKINLK
jgi:hypothetical protein